MSLSGERHVSPGFPGIDGVGAHPGTTEGTVRTRTVPPERIEPADGADRTQPTYSAAANWPHAPSISLPRVSRRVVGMPASLRRRTNSFVTSRVDDGRPTIAFTPPA